MSEARRSYGVGLARRAEEFAEAAEHLVTKEDLGPVSFVFLFLVGHALELAYKSILLNRGATEDELKRIGHDLVKSRTKACACFPGELSELEEAGTDEVVDMISPYYKAKAFEYHITGGYRIPGDIGQVAAITAATVSNIAKWVKSDARARMRAERLSVVARRDDSVPERKELSHAGEAGQEPIRDQA